MNTIGLRAIRKCESCGSQFQLTKTQMKRSLDSWAKNCSHECKVSFQRKQWTEKYDEKRPVLKCVCCGCAFQVRSKQKHKKFCSSVCQIKHRYGDRSEVKKQQLKYVETMMGNPIAKQKIRVKLNKICMINNCFELKDDIFQEWILSLLEGQKKKLEFSAMDTIEKHLWNGFKGLGRNEMHMESIYHEDGKAKY